MTIKSLDGLRGMAVLLVLLSHMSLAGIHLLPGLDFSGAGKSGVYLFFVLSAFLLTWQALDERHLSSVKYWTGYGLRRICRIYPLYALTLVCALGITQITKGYAPNVNSPMDVFWHLGLQKGEGVYWAIPVEFKYYLLLPFVTLSTYWASRLHVFAPILMVLLTIGGASIIWPASETVANSIGLGPYLTMFLAGSLAAYLCTGHVKSVLSRYQLPLEILGAISVITALLTVPSFARFLFSDEIANNSFHREFLFFGIIWSSAVLAVFYGTGLFTKFFELSFCRFVGRVSFSVYLWHFTIIQVVSHHIDLYPTIQFGIVFGLTFIISYLSYRFIERPFISWGHSTSRKLLDS